MLFSSIKDRFIIYKNIFKKEGIKMVLKQDGSFDGLNNEVKKKAAKLSLLANDADYFKKVYCNLGRELLQLKFKDNKLPELGYDKFPGLDLDVYLYGSEAKNDLALLLACLISSDCDVFGDSGYPFKLSKLTDFVFKVIGNNLFSQLLQVNFSLWSEPISQDSFATLPICTKRDYILSELVSKLKYRERLYDTNYLDVLNLESWFWHPLSMLIVCLDCKNDKLVIKNSVYGLESDSDLVTIGSLLTLFEKQNFLGKEDGLALYEGGESLGRFYRNFFSIFVAKKRTARVGIHKLIYSETFGNRIKTLSQNVLDNYLFS